MIKRNRKAHGDFYVYQYSDDNGVFYVGKGRNGRAYTHALTSERDKVCVEIVERNMTHDEAMLLELMLIERYPNLENVIGPPRFSLVGPDEKTHQVYNLSHFCRQHHLDYQYMQDVVSGRLRQYKGWTGQRLNQPLRLS